MQVTREQLLTGTPVGVGFSAVVQLVSGAVYCYHPRDKSIWWKEDFDPSIPRWNAGKWGWTPIIPPRHPGAAVLWEAGFNARNRAANGDALKELRQSAEHRAADWGYRPRARFRQYGELTLWVVRFSNGADSAVAWQWFGPGKFPDVATFERCLTAPLENYDHHIELSGALSVAPDNDEEFGHVLVRQYGGAMWVLIDHDVAVELNLHRHVAWSKWCENDERLSTKVEGAYTTGLTTQPRPAWLRIKNGYVLSARATRGYEKFYPR